jgi:hypothetical protein
MYPINVTFTINNADEAARLWGVIAPQEPVKAEPVKAEPVKAEPVKAEPVKAEPVKAEPVKAEPVKVDHRAEATKAALLLMKTKGRAALEEILKAHGVATISAVKDDETLIAIAEACAKQLVL